MGELGRVGLTSSSLSPVSDSEVVGMSSVMRSGSVGRGMSGMETGK